MAKNPQPTPPGNAPQPTPTDTTAPQADPNAPLTSADIDRLSREGDQTEVSQQQLDETHRNPMPPLPTGAHNGDQKKGTAADQSQADEDGDVTAADLVNPGD